MITCGLTVFGRALALGFCFRVISETTEEVRLAVRKQKIEIINSIPPANASTRKVYARGRQLCCTCTFQIMLQFDAV